MTGATGFIGRHVVAELENRGIPTTVVCRPGDALTRHSDLTSVVEIDLEAPPSDSFEALGRPEAVMHLAWGGLPNYQSPRHVEVELPRHYAFLKSLVSGGLKSLLVTGTCLEYGLQNGMLDERMDARPVTPYGHAKNSLRIELEHLQRIIPFNLTWTRLFYLLGDGQASSSLLPQLEAAARRGEPSFDMSGGRQLRDYSPVTVVAGDLVSLALMEADLGVVNVCSGSPVSVLALVERHIAEHGWTIRPNPGRYPYPDYEPMEFWGARSKMDSYLKARWTR